LTAAPGAARLDPVPDAVPPRTLVDLFEASVAAHGHRPLFVTKEGDRWVETSYAAFSRTVDDLRAGLAGLGVGPGEKVGIIANNRVEWAAAAYATYGLGAVLVPMYESQRDREWAFIVADAGIQVLLASTAGIVRRVSGFTPLRIVVQLDDDDDDGDRTYRGLVEAGAMHPVPVRRPAPGDPACLLYTSGTTAEPRGVILSHANIVSNVVGLSSQIPLPPTTAPSRSSPGPTPSATPSSCTW
jgi:long-chain acyl-CoA synthetase